MGILWTKNSFAFLKFISISSWSALNCNNPKQEKHSIILNNLCISISSLSSEIVSTGAFFSATIISAGTSFSIGSVSLVWKPSSCFSFENWILSKPSTVEKLLACFNLWHEFSTVFLSEATFRFPEWIFSVELTMHWRYFEPFLV